MSEQRETDPPRPLPRKWLPEARAPEGAPVWELRLERILEAAEPRLRERSRSGNAASRGESGADDANWPDVLGAWWRPAAGLAAAAATVSILLLGGLRTGPEVDVQAAFMQIVVSAGEPGALWEGIGIEADPVLAAIVLEGPDE